MGHGRLRHAQRLGQIADADLRLEEHEEDADAARIAEDLEQLRQIEELFFLRHGLRHDLQQILVHFPALAAFCKTVFVHRFLLILYTFSSENQSFFT